MSISRNFWAKFWGFSVRACAKNFTRFLRMYWIIQISFFMLLRLKATTPNFSHLLFFVAATKKCCPTIKERFLFKTFFSKSISNVSKYKKVTLVTEGANCGMTHAFASYVYWKNFVFVSYNKFTFITYFLVSTH